MESEEEPTSKRQHSAGTDFSLCLACQLKTKETLSTPRDSSYATFLSELHGRAGFGNLQLLPISQRLKEITNNDLMLYQAKWHPSCYASITHGGMRDRDMRYFSEACTTQSSAKVAKRKAGRPKKSASIIKHTFIR